MHAVFVVAHLLVIHEFPLLQNTHAALSEDTARLHLRLCNVDIESAAQKIMNCCCLPIGSELSMRIC